MNWTSIISSTELFEAYHSAKENHIKTHVDDPNFKYEFANKYSSTAITFGPYENYKTKILGRTAFITITGENTIGSLGNPSAPALAPAQCADYISIIFGELNTEGKITIDSKNGFPSVIGIKKLQKWYNSSGK